MIYVRAKRWSDRVVRRPDVQAFVGALQGARAAKGVFITTSRFTEDAGDYVTRVQPRVVLIEGRRFADLMIEYGVGVSRLRAYELKRVDEDYFVDDGSAALEVRGALFPACCSNAVTGCCSNGTGRRPSAGVPRLGVVRSAGSSSG